MKYNACRKIRKHNFPVLVQQMLLINFNLLFCTINTWIILYHVQPGRLVVRVLVQHLSWYFQLLLNLLMAQDNCHCYLLVVALIRWQQYTPPDQIHPRNRRKWTTGNLGYIVYWKATRATVVNTVICTFFDRIEPENKN